MTCFPGIQGADILTKSALFFFSVYCTFVLEHPFERPVHDPLQVELELLADASNGVFGALAAAAAAVLLFLGEVAGEADVAEDDLRGGPGVVHERVACLTYKF